MIQILIADDHAITRNCNLRFAHARLQGVRCSSINKTIFFPLTSGSVMQKLAGKSIAKA
jgi:hypothetical protein